MIRKVEYLFSLPKFLKVEIFFWGGGIIIHIQSLIDHYWL